MERVDRELDVSRSVGRGRRTTSAGILEVHTEQLRHASIVSGRGEIDLSTTPLLRQQVLAAVNASTRPNIIVDLLAVTYIDASGLRALEECCKACDQSGQKIIIIAPKKIRRLIEVVGLDERFSLADTMDVALGVLRRARAED